MHNTECAHLLAGAARKDITPPEDCLLDGFAGRTHGAEGIHDSLTVTAAAFSRDGETAVFVGLDLLELTDKQVDEIKKRIEALYSIPGHRIFLNCSHTHAGPLLASRFNRDFCPEGGLCYPDESYVKNMLDAVVSAVGDALDKLSPSTAYYAEGETSIGINRRAKDKSIYKGPAAGYIGIFANIPNPEKAIDRTCPVILVKDSDGTEKFILFGAACHPTTMSHPNYLVSAEYPGVARALIEEKHPGTLSLFIQGIGGDVKPKQVALDDKFRSGDYEDVQIVGETLAREVEEILGADMKTLDITIRSSEKRFPLPFDDTWGEEKFDFYSGPEHSKYRQNWSKLWQKKLKVDGKLPESMDISLSILELTPSLRFLGIAGELLTDMGLILKALFPAGRTLPCGYTNGRIGYIPDSSVLEEGGYEATETVFFTTGIPAPWRKDIEETLTNNFIALEKSLS